MLTYLHLHYILKEKMMMILSLTLRYNASFFDCFRPLKFYLNMWFGYNIVIWYSPRQYSLGHMKISQYYSIYKCNVIFEHFLLLNAFYICRSILCSWHLLLPKSTQEIVVSQAHSWITLTFGS